MNITDIIKGLGPTVAAALAGPTGGLSLGVWGLVKAITGADDEKEAADILNNDPGKLAAFQVKARELALTELSLRLKDRDSARVMNVAMQDTKQAWVQPTLSFLAVFGFFATLAGLYLGDAVDASTRDILLVLIGILGAVFKDVYGFYFGSSKGSKDKDALLNIK